ncbi:NTP transferase domain-containing protein [Thermodesulfobacteriota bacterium]
MKAVILAAGIGKRLKCATPKCLTALPDGESILARQVRILRQLGVDDIIVVVGYKKEQIAEAFPDLQYVYNPRFRETNTSKSLLAALTTIHTEDVLWLNGDVCLEQEVVSRVVRTPGNVVAVNQARCGDEEVKYVTSDEGYISGIAKTIAGGEGEAVGVNKIIAESRPLFVEKLEACDDNDYFEKAIEYAIREAMLFSPVDISDCKCIEVDFEADLKAAHKLFSEA